MKEIDDLEFTDDYMFGEVLKNEDLCRGVLERLLKIKIGRIEYPELQKSIKIGYDVHGIRLDVYVKDSDTVYDLEMQNSCLEELGKRTRFYQSVIDTDHLLKGKHYSELVESKIIFICKKDPFDLGLQCYTFENICVEDRNFKLNDKTQKLIYNSQVYEEEPDENLRAFMHFVNTNEATDDFTRLLEMKVAGIKKSENFRTEYIKMYIGMEDEKRRAVKEAVEQAVAQAVEKAVREISLSATEKNKIENAKALLCSGKLTLEEISMYINLPIEEVQKLAEEVKNNA